MPEVEVSKERSYLTKKSAALFLGIAFSCLCGWVYAHSFNLVFVILGAPGGLAYLAISQTNAEDGAAKLALEGLYLVVNSAFYYMVFRYAQRLIARRIAS